MERSELTDAQWDRLRPLLPPQKLRTGRPASDHRTVINGILWILRTGSPWGALPDRYGSWKTVSSRFYRWQRAGVWNRVLSDVQRQADREGRLDWSLPFVDSTMVRAHQHAAGAKEGIRMLNRWVGAAAGTAGKSIFGASGTANRWSSC